MKHRVCLDNYVIVIINWMLFLRYGSVNCSVCENITKKSYVLPAKRCWTNSFWIYSLIYIISVAMIIISYKWTVKIDIMIKINKNTIFIDAHICILYNMQFKIFFFILYIKERLHIKIDVENVPLFKFISICKVK